MDSHSGSALEMADISAGYGRSTALTGFELRVAPGELLAVLGHNGAGKTTALRVAAGLKAPSSGTTRMDGADLGRLPAYARARRGISLVPEGVAGLFPTLTVAQNLDAVMPCEVNAPGPQWDGMRDHLLDIFSEVLVDRANQLAGSMSGGQRQMLAIAMALYRRPSVLLLDEPSTGLAPSIVSRILSVIRTLTETTSTAVVLVEQNLSHALKVADRALIVQSGQVAAEFEREKFPEPTELWRYF